MSGARVLSIPATKPNMDATTYKIIHLTGISVLALGVGGMMADGGKRKAFAILQGVGLLVMLVSGFGLVAKLNAGFPPFVITKIILWGVIAMMPTLIRKTNAPLWVGVLVSVFLVGTMAWLGVMHRLPWGR